MTGTRKLKRAGWIAFFILPGALIVFVFIVLPLFISLFNSFFNCLAECIFEFYC